MTTTDSQLDLRRRVLHDTDLIPPLPEVLVQIVGLLNEPSTEPEDLEELIRFDQSLVARLLGMVNSPFFGLRRPVTSVRQGIMVLGYQNLRSLLMLTGTAKYLDRDFSRYGYEDGGLWRHSVGVAAAAKNLAARLGEPRKNCEEIFTGALLHDIGKMVLHSHLGRFPVNEVAAYDRIESAESALLGMTHAEAGLLVCDKWNLEPVLCAVVAGHHGYDRNVEFARAVAIVRLADAVGHELGAGYAPGAVPAKLIDPMDLELLRLSPEEWEESRTEMILEMESALVHLARVYS